jgi:hypothetical protein
MRKKHSAEDRYTIQIPLEFRAPFSYGWAIYINEESHPIERSKVGYRTAAAANLQAMRTLQDLTRSRAPQLS